MNVRICTNSFNLMTTGDYQGEGDSESCGQYNGWTRLGVYAWSIVPMSLSVYTCTYYRINMAGQTAGSNTLNRTSPMRLDIPYDVAIASLSSVAL